MHLPSIFPASELPENVRYREFYDSEARVYGVDLKISRSRAVRLPLDTYVPCAPVDRLLSGKWTYPLFAALFVVLAVFSQLQLL